mmetsp:Transcript_12543/g.43661  ORF Transcript_12543/g.43661 Transcript_12543/m.43661 type:complete len:634 (-) Transcript_12543:694-2595(-)
MKMLPSLSHQSYRADSSLQQLSSTSTTTSVFITDNPETERNKVMVKKKQANNSYNEVVLDDIVAWQPGKKDVMYRSCDSVSLPSGLVQRAMDGRGILKIRSEKEFLPNTLDTGMALQKAQGVVKLVQLRDKVIKTRMQAKGNFKGELLPIAPRSDVDFVTQNKHKQFQSTQDAKITDLLKACAERVQRELETCERAIVSESEWRKDVEVKLIARQERKHRRSQQARWLPLVLLAAATARMMKVVAINQELRYAVRRRQAAASRIQNTFKGIMRRRHQLKISLKAARYMQYKMKRWTSWLHENTLNRSIDLVKKLLYDFSKMRSFARHLSAFKKNLKKCQDFARAFLQGIQKRRIENRKLWDQIAKDMIGDESSRMWMFRLLNNTRYDTKRQKYISERQSFKYAKLEGQSMEEYLQSHPLARDFLIDQEIRAMRIEYVAALREYAKALEIYKTKVKAYSLVQEMGIDADFARAKFGIQSLRPKPIYPIKCPRKVLRRHLEETLKAIGVRDFVNDELFEEMKSRIDTILKEATAKLSKLVDTRTSARELFDFIDENNNGTLEEEEVQSFMQSIGVKINSQESRILFVQLDINNDGSLSFPEFMDRLLNWNIQDKKPSRNREKSVVLKAQFMQESD